MGGRDIPEDTGKIYDKQTEENGFKLLTVQEFLDVRTAVATALRNISPQSKAYDNQAEFLMKKGYIDVRAVLKEIHPDPVKDEPEEPGDDTP